MILGLGGIDHLDGLMQDGVEQLALGWNRPHSKLAEGIEQLLVDEFDPPRSSECSAEPACNARSKLSRVGSSALIASAKA